jgi:hypothetical protein
MELYNTDGLLWATCSRCHGTYPLNEIFLSANSAGNVCSNCYVALHDPAREDPEDTDEWDDL